MVDKTKGTQVVSDDDELQTVGGDEELQTVDDEAPAYPRWLEPGMRWDTRVTATGQGTNFDGDPCFQFDGWLLAEAPNFDSDGNKFAEPVGREVRVNAGQPILERKLRRAERQFGGLVGRRLVVVYKGLTPTNGGKKAKDFDVLVGERVTFDDLRAADE